MTPLAVVLILTAITGDAAAQSRRRFQDPPPPPPQALPTISSEAGRCSFAFHDALVRINSGSVRELMKFDSLARVPEPGLTGRWLFWAKSGKGGKAATTEQVCAETATKSGRERCVRWETRRIEAAIAGAQPTAEELTALRALDGFVGDRAAPLEFGSNGRQFVVLQRVAAEIGSYAAQSRHPALCNGVQQMMDFHAANLAGLRKRIDDINALAAKVAGLARQRVVAARDLRVAEAKAAAAAAAAAASSSPVAAEGSTVGEPAKLAPPPRGPVPAGANAAELARLALEGLLTADQSKAVDAEPSVLRKLQRARELVTAAAMPDATASVRASVGAALRMIEAMSYSDLQVARMKQFDGLFFGTIDGIRGAHRSNCTCGDN